MAAARHNGVYYQPGGEPFFLRGSTEVGCLCVHGITAMPQEMKWLGEHLHAQGYTVYGPRLAGHGTDLAHHARTTWPHWYGSVRDGYAILRQQCRQVFVIGLSMGGLLSLHLGTREQPDGIACLAGPVEVDQPLLPYGRYLKHVWRYTGGEPDDNHKRVDSRMRELQAQRGEVVIGRAVYPQHSIAAASQLYDLMQVTRGNLDRLTAPLLLVYSEQDGTVPARNQGIIAGAVGTPAADLHQLTLRESDHLLTLDIEMETVFAAVADFVAQYAE